MRRPIKPDIQTFAERIAGMGFTVYIAERGRTDSSQTTQKTVFWDSNSMVFKTACQETTGRRPQ